MPQSFYSDVEYRKRQSEIVKLCWKSGIYQNKIKPYELRQCKNSNCKNTFEAKPCDPKISKSISALPKQFWKCLEKPKITLVCLACGKRFKVTPYLVKTRKYCCRLCAITTIGKRTTSPKASKGISGIRKDIDPNICFYSTWEANMARVYNLVGIKWLYAPKIFDLKEHTYRPDFYLPDFDTYVEVKNYLGDYSLKRDQVFRKIYPNIKLELILKNDYLEIKSNYKYFIRNWEF